MKITVAAVQMPSELLQRASNLEVADHFLSESHRAGAQLSVLPEMFNTGYGLLPDFGPCSEGADGPTLRHLSHRSRQWGIGIAAGFVERDGRHLYDAMALCLPAGTIHVYRKRHLVFWEAFRFRAGRTPLVVLTPWGRVGLAVCADMMDRRVWDDYRGRIDLAVVSSAWPEFACRHSGRRHCLFGHVGHMAAVIPTKVARDLNVPVIFANQTGTTCTTIPVLGLTLAMHIADRFAGQSCICDGCSALPIIAGAGTQLILSEVTTLVPQRRFS
ncbi:MAG: carbon-nitrogen hydrolase family protein [Isosphaeraceae bacterium]